MLMKRKEQRMNLQPLAIDTTGENSVLVTILVILAIIALIIWIVRR